MTTAAPRPPRSPETIPSGMLMQEYRETLLRLGADRTDATLRRRADALEEELNRRVAW